MNLKPLNFFKEKRVKKGSFYTSRFWKQIRKEHLRMNPLCKMCEDEGLIKEANTVDHIIPRSDGGSDYDSNLQSLCTHHHQRKSGVEGKNRMYENHPKWIKPGG